MNFTTFDLLIGRFFDGEYPVTVIESPAGETETAVMARLTPDDYEILDALEQIEALDTDAELLHWLGGEFFDQLFTGQIATLYRASLAMVQAEGKRLRVRLRIDSDADELATLPWELLYDAQEDVALAVSPDTDLMRHFPVRKPTRSTMVQPPLRVLVVISNPQGVPSLDVAAERALIQEAIEGQKEEGHAMVLRVVERATPAAIADALRTYDPHVFHYIGHGMNEGGRGYAVLEDEQGDANLVDDHSFREIFAQGKELRLVVLNACRSATVAGTKSLNGLAPSLLQRRVSAVIAMQYEVLDSTAIIFAREFYRSLAAGLPVDEAVSTARRGIYVEMGRDGPDWATPVLYLRAKDGVLFTLEAPEPAVPAIPPPPAPDVAPHVPGFVGREVELADYRRKLAQDGIAVVVGMVGVGKTAVAANLATDYGQADKVFWHTFHPDEGVETIIWKLAGFLAWHDRPSVWEMLQGVVLGGGQLPPADVLLDYIFQSIKEQGYLICLDDFHHVEGDRLWAILADRLRAQVLAGEVRVLIVSGRVPDFVRITQHTLLGGLSVADSKLLLEHREVVLAESNFVKLYERTAGNAELLTLTADAMLGSPDPAGIIDRLATSADVERFLLDQVDQYLGRDEKLVMNGVAALLGHPGSRDAIEEVLDGRNVRRTLPMLTNRFLLLENEGTVDRVYVQHRMVQSFYYDLLSRRERRAMHQRAAQWYELEEADPFRAALHYQYAGDSAKAVRLATQDVWALINRGHSTALSKLLQGFEPQQLDPAVWLEVKLAQGEVFAYWGESEQAQACYQEVLSQTASQSDDAGVRPQRVRAYHGLGELLLQESPQEALSWLQQGLEANAGADPQKDAMIQVSIGTIQMWQGDYGAAADTLHRGLAGLPPGPSQWRTFVLQPLGVVTVEGKGDLEEGIAYVLDALQIARQMHDHFSQAEILSTLGLYRFYAGDWPGAQTALEQARALAQQIGSDKEMAHAEIGLGALGIKAERDDLTIVQEHLERGLRLAQKTHNALDEFYALLNLGELHIRLGQWQAAGDFLDRAEALLVQLENRHLMPNILYLRAQVKMAIGEPKAALQEAVNAVALARDGSEAIELGIALRVLGQIHNALDQRAQAADAYAESAAILADRYPFELARTQAQWALFLLANGDAAVGNRLKQAAEVAFQACGALYDLAVLEQEMNR